MKIFGTHERATEDPWETLSAAARRYVNAAHRSIEHNGFLNNVRLGLSTAKLMDAATRVMPDHPVVIAWNAPEGYSFNDRTLELANTILLPQTGGSSVYEVVVHPNPGEPQLV